VAFVLEAGGETRSAESARIEALKATRYWVCGGGVPLPMGEVWGPPQTLKKFFARNGAF